ncbi:hypothetical protein GZL_00236 [Streptomyces sp. 769]|nr:hypothetical protein GZL_00236 [Streptomyces sp. 769]
MRSGCDATGMFGFACHPHTVNSAPPKEPSSKEPSDRALSPKALMTKVPSTHRAR